jgi:hypothetical protein
MPKHEPLLTGAHWQSLGGGTLYEELRVVPAGPGVPAGHAMWMSWSCAVVGTFLPVYSAPSRPQWLIAGLPRRPVCRNLPIVPAGEARFSVDVGPVQPDATRDGKFSDRS